jgi:hypothetical protein
MDSNPQEATPWAGSGDSPFIDRLVQPLNPQLLAATAEHGADAASSSPGGQEPMTKRAKRRLVRRRRR